ncbi:MAG: DUF5989 family protein [Bdellovibrionales bacterium]
MSEFIRDFIGFLTTHKKYWLTPIVIVMILLGTLIYMSHSSSVAPFIYTIF